MVNASSHVRRTPGRRPLPSAPKTSAAPVVRSADHDGRLGVARRGPRPERRPLDLLQVAPEVDDDRNRNVLDRSGRGLGDRCRHTGRVPLGDDDPVRARTFGATDDRAQVVRVGDLVEADHERPLALDQRVRVGVAVRLAEGDDALVIARVRRVAQAPLGDDLQPEPGHLPQPRLRREGALGDEQLEDLALAGAVQLAHRPPAVDEVAGHALGISRKPSGTSWTSHPSASISARSSSARA